MWITIYSFNKKLDTLKVFLSELASREDEIITFGLKRVSEWESYIEAATIIDDFEVDILEIEDLAKHIDKDIFNQISNLKNTSKIIDELTTISVQLSVLTNKKSLSTGGDILNNILFQLPYLSGMFKHRQLFHKEQISIQKTLVSLTRLGSLVKRLQKIYRKASDLDDEIFKPSKINSDVLIDCIDNAILSLENTTSVSSVDKERLIEYLIATKVEVSGDKPNWNKAVGALVIVATLLGGVAVAPQAYNNVTQAIQHILGTSIEKHIPNILPPPSKEEDIPNEPDDIETVIT